MTRRKRFCNFPSRRRISRAALVLLSAAGLLTGAPVRAGVPGWLRAAANSEIPSHSENFDAAVLLDEVSTLVKDNGEIETVRRRAVKILRPPGREHELVIVHFDDDTRLSYLKGWCVSASGKDYEVKEKDAVETSIFSEALYSDARKKLLRIPAAEPGNVVGYEYRRKERRHLLQGAWYFQGTDPIRRTRFVLELPPGWEFETVWFNHQPVEPTEQGRNRWVWELTNVPALELEPDMPSFRAVAGWMGVTYFSPASRTPGGSWQKVGAWYHQLTSNRPVATPEIRRRTEELTSTSATPMGKIRALAAYVQRSIRYVAIEIGIGGFQPHAAADVYANGYGDCKDKVTLLISMLREVGIDAHYVLIHTDRGFVTPEFPSASSFNHAIAAIRLPNQELTEPLSGVTENEALGKLIFFDPTDPITKLGDLPPTLQGSLGLVVTQGGGQLVRLPLLPPVSNRLLRVAQLELQPSGTLSGSVREIRWGAFATSRRRQFLAAGRSELGKVLENYLAQNLAGFHLTGGHVKQLEKYDENLILDYSFQAENYAGKAGALLLLRPRVMGYKSAPIYSAKDKTERHYPFEFPYLSLQTDQFNIVLPPGFEVDEAPPPLDLDFPFGSYKSSVDVADGVLEYRRSFEIKQTLVPLDSLDDLLLFMGRIAEDERAAVVLKPAGP